MKRKASIFFATLGVLHAMVGPARGEDAAAGTSDDTRPKAAGSLKAASVCFETTWDAKGEPTTATPAAPDTPLSLTSLADYLGRQGINPTDSGRPSVEWSIAAGGKGYRCPGTDRHPVVVRATEESKGPVGGTLTFSVCPAPTSLRTLQTSQAPGTPPTTPPAASAATSPALAEEATALNGRVEHCAVALRAKTCAEGEFAVLIYPVEDASKAAGEHGFQFATRCAAPSITGSATGSGAGAAK